MSFNQTSYLLSPSASFPLSFLLAGVASSFALMKSVLSLGDSAHYRPNKACVHTHSHIFYRDDTVYYFYYYSAVYVVEGNIVVIAMLALLCL